MRIVEPKVWMIAAPAVEWGAVGEYLDAVAASVGVEPFGWTTDAPSDAEALVEIASRTCYRSWRPGLNANVTRVREGNAPHLANVVAQKHGSVFEHAQVSFAFHDVSRVFTHELITHRAGTAKSQESLRYVRLTDLRFWLPPDLDDDDPNGDTVGDKTLREFVVSVVEQLEEVQKKLARATGLEDEATFAAKKKLTSALRRLAPHGLATSVIWSANIRTLRFVIPLRTDEAAEAEMRLVFDRVGQICKARFPNAFADLERLPMGDGTHVWRPRGVHGEGWKI